jgi:hypothetical protein
MKLRTIARTALLLFVAMSIFFFVRSQFSKSAQSGTHQNALGTSLLRDLIGHGTDGSGVFLLGAKDEHGGFVAFEQARGHRYCQAYIEARHGGSVVLETAGPACPAAAEALSDRHATACQGQHRQYRGASTSLCPKFCGCCRSRRFGGDHDVAAGANAAKLSDFKVSACPTERMS